MMTNAASTPSARQHVATPPALAQQVVIVNGNPQMLEALDTVLEAGHYDVVFVESSEHAYSQIKRVQPDLVILCVHIDDSDGLQVLSMLKLDDETRGIPVLTYTIAQSGEESDDDYLEPSDGELFAPAKSEMWMN